MKETSWRTLMLLTTLFILVVIFEGTVRPYRPRTPLIGPAMGGGPPADCNKVQDKRLANADVPVGDDRPAPSQPEPVVTVAQTRPAWLNDRLGNLNETRWASLHGSDDPNESTPPESEDPSQSSPPVQE